MLDALGIACESVEKELIEMGFDENIANYIKMLFHAECGLAALAVNKGGNFSLLQFPFVYVVENQTVFVK